MNIEEAINRFDSLIHNTYSQEDKLAWLSRVDGMVYNHIIMTHEGHEDVSFPDYTDTIDDTIDNTIDDTIDDTIDLETELLIPEPYSDAYLYWLEAQVHYYNGEYHKYNNAIVQFNTEYEAYADYYNRNNKPINEGKRFIF